MPPERAGAGAPPDAAIEAVVRGDVQGVGFRWFVRTEAERLGLTGWVANEAGRSVRVVAEGPAPDLERLVALLRSGPPGAVVAEVAVDRPPATGRFGSFSIRSGGHPGD
jgi:acylphosphatase